MEKLINTEVELKKALLIKKACKHIVISRNSPESWRLWYKRFSVNFLEILFNRTTAPGEYFSKGTIISILGRLNIGLENSGDKYQAAVICMLPWKLIQFNIIQHY